MIIGFSGKAGSGKDTAGNYLKLKGWQHYQFARPLKMIVAKMLDLPLTAMENRELKEHRLKNKIVLTEDDAQLFMSLCPSPILGHVQANAICDAFEGKTLHTVRELLQFIGTDIGRDLVSKSIWIDAAKKNITNLHKSGNVVITDVRFENEWALIKEHGGLILEIKRDGTGAGTHPSEQKLPNTDYTIDNNSYKQRLYDTIEQIIKENT